MAKDGSASVRKETPHANNTEQTIQSPEPLQTDLTEPTAPPILSRSIRKRALRIINNQAVDPRMRMWVRYALGINDPWTASLVQRAEAGEIFDDNFSLQTNQSSGDQAVNDLSIEYDETLDHSMFSESAEYQLDARDASSASLEDDQALDEKLEALSDLICRPGNEPDIKSGALLLLMSTIENSSRPHELATTTKYLAFLRCCELNLFNMVGEQVSLVERRLLMDVR